MKAVVAIDNKPSSQAIVDALVKMHWFEGTELVLLCVVPPGTGYGSSDQVPPGLAELENIAVDLHNCLKHCEVSFLVREGDPKEVITGASKELQADLIVLGSNCKNTLERLLLGSVCQSVIAEAHCPVIIAKTPCCLAREVSPAFRTILIAVDNSIFSDAAIGWVANFEWAPHTNFIITAVTEIDTDFDEVTASLQRRANELSRRVGTNRIILETTDGKPSQSIIDMAKAHYVDMIIMPAHNRTGLQKLILGEVAEEVSHNAPCAVAIVGGLVSQAGSWAREEAYGKVKLVIEAGAFADRDFGNMQDVSAHTMPGGM